jgi:hypothetical protein
VKHTPGVDNDRLARHGFSTAHGDHHVGAIVLVGGPLQERAGRGTLDLLGPEIGRRSRTLQKSRRHAIHERLGRHCYRHAAREVDEPRLRHCVGDR